MSGHLPLPGSSREEDDCWSGYEKSEDRVFWVYTAGWIVNHDKAFCTVADRQDTSTMRMDGMDGGGRAAGGSAT